MSSAKRSLDDLKIERPVESGRSRAGWVWMIVLLALVSGAIAFWVTRPKALVVTTVTARASGGSVSDRTVLNASGYVTARRQATVSSKVTGKVVEVLFEEGMSVKEGQVLARLDDSNVKASLAVSEAQLAAARASVDEMRAQLKQSELEFQRVRQLATGNIASQSELDRAEAEAATTRARLERLEHSVVVAEREIGLWRQQLEDLLIRAPFSGIITTKNAQPGEMISPVSAGGGFTRTGIGTIVDMGSLEIEIDVNESYINRVQPGQPVEAALDAYPDWKIPCAVIAIIPTADRQKSTVRVRVGFNELDPRILPQMGVKVAFRGTETAGPSRTVIVPKNALLHRDGRDLVFIARNGRAERRAVTVGQRNDTEVELTAGIASGEPVIVNSPASLADGVRVRIQ